MKIANFSKVCQEAALKQLLANYQETPHPATGLSPALMMFYNGQEGTFLRVTTSDDAIKDARQRDYLLKERPQVKDNKRKYC